MRCIENSIHLHMEEQNTSKLTKWTQSLTFKVLVTGLLILILLIPLEMVKGVIHEREQKQDEAAWSLSSTWGTDQTVAPPILRLPIYEYNKENKLVFHHHLYLNPDEVTFEVQINPQEKHKGIFKVPVYESEIQYSGSISPEKLKTAVGSSLVPLWSKAQWVVHISDLGGLSGITPITANNQTSEFKPDQSNSALNEESIAASYRGDDSTAIKFSGKLQLRGTRSLHFIPLAGNTKTKINGIWKNPSFSGAFSPTSDIQEDRFSASWNILEINRPLPSTFTSSLNSASESKFGVDLFQPMNYYKISYRSVKYAILILITTFSSFLLFQLIYGINLHTLQYVLIGAAQVLFYSLLVSLSEQVGFNLAWAISTLVVVTMIGFYSKSALKNKNLTIGLVACIFFSYLFNFIILNLEDLALLFGTIGLFGLLGVVMYFTRNINSKTDEQHIQ